MAIHRLTLTVALKVIDNEARSALEAVRVKMGLGDDVIGLTREDLWELDVEAPSHDDARAVVKRLVETTNLFANPNKHTHAFGAGAALKADEVAVLVSDRESSLGPALTSSVRRLGVGALVSARKWVRWRVRLARATARADERLVRRIAVTTSRTEGLLSNPHSQVARAVFPWGEERVLAE